MTYKHTKAPFYIQDDKIYGQRTDGLPIAEIFSQLISLGEADANAMLFKAAPELLEALETAVEIIKDSYGEESMDIASDCQAVNVMMVAINKAKGV